MASIPPWEDRASQIMNHLEIAITIMVEWRCTAYPTMTRTYTHNDTATNDQAQFASRRLIISYPATRRRTPRLIVNPPMLLARGTLGHSGGGGAAFALSGPPETREEEALHK